MINNRQKTKIRWAALVAFTLVLATGLAGCKVDRLRVTWEDDDKEVSQKLSELKGFEEIAVMGSPNVVYQQGDSCEVKLVGPQEGIDQIVTRMEGKTLRIRNKGKHGMLNFSTGKEMEVTVYVTSPDLTSIQLLGSGDFQSRGRLDTDQMTIRLLGSGDLTVEDVICDRCKTELLGSGDLKVKRLEALQSDVTIIGSGDVNINHVNTRNTQLTLQGSGDIEASFNDGCGSVNAQLTGSGDIELKGVVRELSKKKIGSGEIQTEKLRIDNR